MSASEVLGCGAPESSPVRSTGSAASDEQEA